MALIWPKSCVCGIILVDFPDNICDFEEDVQKIMEEKFISRGTKKLSQFVVSEIFKKCSNKVGDYLVIEVTHDEYDYEYVKFRIIEPLYYKTFGLWTRTIDDIKEMKVVIVRMDEGLVMVEFDELANIIQNHIAS